MKTGKERLDHEHDTQPNAVNLPLVGLAAQREVKPPSTAACIHNLRPRARRVERRRRHGSFWARPFSFRPAVASAARSASSSTVANTSASLRWSLSFAKEPMRAIRRTPGQVRARLTNRKTSSSKKAADRRVSVCHLRHHVYGA